MKRIFLFILFFLVCQYSFASENIISSLVIDNIDEREIDVVMNKDKMYLPCKYILAIFEIPYKENHVEKSLYFKNACIKNSTVYIDGAKQNQQSFFVQSGMTGIKNEFFISAETLATITGKNISASPQQLMAFIQTKSEEEISAAKSNDNPFLVIDKTPKIEAHETLVLPNPRGVITLDSIGFSNNMMSDSYSQIYKDSKNTMMSYNNNTKVTLAGKMKSGDYKVDFGSNSYAANPFSFSGISPQYRNQIDRYDYVLGKVDAWDFGKNSLGSDVMGVQIKDHVDKRTNYRQIEGNVDPKSTVKVYINDNFEKELNTYGGYYSLKDVNYNGQVQKVRIEELLADGSKKEVLQRQFRGDEGQKNVPEHDVFYGLNGMQDRLWASNGCIYQNNTKKFVTGGKYKHDITEKLSFENFFLSDKIVSSQSNSDWGRSILNNRKYLSFSTIKNMNMLEGQTYMGLFRYKHNEKMNSSLCFGGSNSMSQSRTTQGGQGFALNYENDWQVNENNSLKGNVFAYSPDFYSAGSSGGGFLSDRVGVSLSGNTKIKNTSISGTYSKYKSNFGKIYDGGLMDFDEYNLIARMNFKKAPSIMLRTNTRRGQNGLGEIISSSYELSANKHLKCFSLNGGIRSNSYSNQYNDNDSSSYNSEYSTVYTEVGFPLGKRFGSMNLSHEMVSNKSDTTSDSYNIMRVGYSTPSIKSVSLNLMGGYHYTGLNKGLDFNAGVMKRLKSGSSMSLNYRFNRTPCYIVDNMYLPSNMRHSITVDFSELYGLADGGIQALGTNNMNKGFLQARAFLDVNKNGIQDKGEPNIENIPIKLENDSDVLLTDKNGKTSLRPEESGVYRIELFEDELPTFLAVHNKTAPSRYIKINEKERTDVAFGLISSVGNINGSLTVKDEFNTALYIKDVVISIVDTEGQEVNYTSINEDGTFSVSGLNPGKYTIAVDKELQEAFHIRPEKDSENYTVDIPPEYKDYVNIDNVNLNYRYGVY